MKAFSLRAPEKLIKEINKLAKLEKTDKSLILRDALQKGLAKVKLDIAIKLFSERKISTSEAVEIADLSIGEFMEEITARGIDSGINLDDLKETLQEAVREIK